MTPHARPLTPLEVDTLRVALALLFETRPGNRILQRARETMDVPAIASDRAIAQLLRELEGADVDVRRAGP